MSLGDSIRPPHLQAGDLTILQKLVSCFCAYTQQFTHLLNVHHVGVFPEHEFIGITLRNSAGIHKITCLSDLYY